MSLGSEPSLLFSASCISAALPSKNLPHPDTRQFGVSKGRSSWALTTDKERVACEYCPAGIVLHVEADTVLCMARRVHSFDLDVSQLEGFFMRGRLGYAFAVFAADNRQIRCAQLGELPSSAYRKYRVHT